MIFFNNKVMLQFCIAMLIFIISLAAAHEPFQEDKKILRSSIDLRDGPGVFHEWTGRLFKGTVIKLHETEEGWIRISTREYNGWIPDYPELFDGNESETDENDFEGIRHSIYSNFGDEEYDSENSGGFASPTQVAAAVRGFSRQYSIQRAGESQSGIELQSLSEIDPRVYRNFKRDRIGRWNRNRAQRRFAISADDVLLFDHKNESIGWAVAKRLASEGIIQNTEFQNYLSLLGFMITESSHRYDLQMHIYLMDKESISGYSTPAGVIFIAKGAVEFMQSEAELVYFIAHELAHIQFRHGIREVEEREVSIKRDEAFVELRQLLADEPGNEEYERVTGELSDWADQVFEYIVSERLNEYEYAADYWALVYMYRLGYDPGSALNLLRRIHLEEGGFQREIGTLEWKGPALENRIERMLQVFEDHPEFSEQGMINSEVYKNKKEVLR